MPIDIEALGGRIIPLINMNTVISTKMHQMLLNYTDGSKAIGIQVSKGERALFKENTMLKNLDLFGVPPAAKGTHKFKVVTFDVDEKGIFSVSIERYRIEKISITVTSK